MLLYCFKRYPRVERICFYSSRDHSHVLDDPTVMICPQVVIFLQTVFAYSIATSIVAKALVHLDNQFVGYFCAPDRFILGILKDP